MKTPSYEKNGCAQKNISSKMEALKFARKWIESWNSHNLEDILSQYSEDIEITSPIIKLTGGIDTRTLQGKEVVSEYWRKVLKKYQT